MSPARANRIFVDSGGPRISVGTTLVFLALCLVVVWWIFKIGDKISR